MITQNSEKSNGTSPTTTTPKSEVMSYGDVWVAKRIERDHGTRLLYVNDWKKWLDWTGTHWRQDNQQAVMELARQTAMGMLHQAVVRLEDAALVPDEERHAKTKAAQNFYKFTAATLNHAKLTMALKQAESFPSIARTPDGFDTHLWLLNCANGTLNLQTGELQPHQQSDLLTKCLSIPYDPDATCPTWEQFLWRIMGGSQDDDNPDMGAGELENRREADERARSLIDFLQRAAGYALTGSTQEECLFILHGTGANGKSTFLETLQDLLGEYAKTMPMSSLMAMDKSDGIPNDIARLRGARVVTSVEVGDGRRLNEERIKQLTSKDTITARFLHQEFFDFRATHKIFIGCNHLPNIRGTDDGIWRRIRLIPFAVTIPEGERQKDLSIVLRAELPGILAWAVRGCLQWQQAKDLLSPDTVKDATAAYRGSMDLVGKFLEDCCLVNEKVRTKATTLYEAYKRWCEAGSERALTQTAFGTRLEEMGFKAKKQSIKWREGVGLLTKPTGEDVVNF